MAVKRVLISIDEADLAMIDDAARSAGENRSQYLLRAAVLRSEHPLAVTRVQHRAIMTMIEVFGPDTGLPPHV